MNPISLSSFETLLFALLVYLLGHRLNKQTALLNHYCIPAPVTGGLLSSSVITLLSAVQIVDIRFDNSLMSYFMLIFFTTVGLGANFRLIKLGGKILMVYWLACGFLALAQNIIGVSMASALGLDPLIGVLAGAVSMEGGHGAAATFGKTIEELGVANAMPVGLAAATLGLVAGSLSGGPVAKKLIEQYNLTPETFRQEQHAQSVIDAVQGGKSSWSADKVLHMLMLITACCVAGQWLAKGFVSLTGFSLPAYVPAMFLAVLARNLLDLKNTEIVDFKLTTLIGNISLAVFLTIALMGINLIQIADLALSLMMIVAVQVLFVVWFAYFVLFKLLGKNYDAAVMAAGFCGHGLGATPNAIANMDAVAQKYGYSYQAFIIVPVVGAFLIDLFGMPIIITTINILSNP
ncbi:sodium/glutamate symporter [Neisseria animalis]|uniref:Sodium/glutamate symporter n=1 Tax=Neisseria animalis TaxID=492 RepID=A0A5P3MWN6_NEIAN|nr:sodium/glutamate symporter [Neisseria animalis]QEY25069.1 sodium/glutamate symporter [Neisseria animalis]ROW33129.1 sodium/glutamate symporter [Neisseria animalis]VEE07353.1 glutamate permease [Neisseria animalis]